MVVHAFADVPYNRSSFHFSGTSEAVTSVVSKLSIDTFASIPYMPEDHDENAHPTVGLIDHISVMPLHCEDTEQQIDRATVDAAHGIGRVLEEADVQVYYYGAADLKEKMPLSKVRKYRTNFFETGHSRNDGGNDERKTFSCVGCPDSFTENFNIRLKFSQDELKAKSLAQSLSRTLRERDGGLPGVEALTLRYRSDDSVVEYEVACNLLRPKVGSVEQIQKVSNSWLDSIQSGLQFKLDMESYRVGTTRQQCLDALSLSGEDLESHNKKIYLGFEKYLSD